MNTTMSNVKSMAIMPPAPELINSSSIYYRETTSHSPVVPPQQSPPLMVWDDYRGKDREEGHDDDLPNDDKSIEFLKQREHCPRSHRLEFAVFLKVLFKLLDKESLAIKSQAQAMIMCCLQRAKRQDNNNNCCSSSSWTGSRSSDDGSSSDHTGESSSSSSSSLLFHLENMELPLRSLVGESVWVCAYHYTKLYQQKHHRPSRIFRSNMQFNRGWMDNESSSSSSSSSRTTTTSPFSSSLICSTTSPPSSQSMVMAAPHGCSTVSLSSASDAHPDQSSQEWDGLDASVAGEESWYQSQDNVQEYHDYDNDDCDGEQQDNFEEYHAYYNGDCVAERDDDTVELINNLDPMTPTLITSTEVETEYYNFLRDEF